MSFTLFKPPRSEEGSLRGNAPQAGFRAAALTYPKSRSEKNRESQRSRRQETARSGNLPRLCEFPMPKATIEIQAKFERITKITAKTSYSFKPDRNRNCRLTAPFRFLLIGAARMGYVGLQLINPQTYTITVRGTRIVAMYHRSLRFPTLRLPVSPTGRGRLRSPLRFAPIKQS